MISRPDPLRDTLLFVRYAQGVIAGLAVAAAVSFVNVRTSSLRTLSYLPLVGAFIAVAAAAVAARLRARPEAARR